MCPCSLSAAKTWCFPFKFSAANQYRPGFQYLDNEQLSTSVVRLNYLLLLSRIRGLQLLIPYWNKFYLVSILLSRYLDQGPSLTRSRSIGPSFTKSRLIRKNHQSSTSPWSLTFSSSGWLSTRTNSTLKGGVK